MRCSCVILAALFLLMSFAFFCDYFHWIANVSFSAPNCYIYSWFPTPQLITHAQSVYSFTLVEKERWLGGFALPALPRKICTSCCTDCIITNGQESRTLHKHFDRRWEKGVSLRASNRPARYFCSLMFGFASCLSCIVFIVYRVLCPVVHLTTRTEHCGRFSMILPFI